MLDVAETSQRMVGHTPTEQLSGTLFQKTMQGKVTCKISVCDNFLGLCVFLSQHIGLLGPCIYIFRGKQIHTEKLILVQQ